MPKGHALIIEDERHISRFLEFVLRKDGYATNAALSGAEGLAKISAFAPQIVLLDLQLPDMDGLEVLRQIRANPSYENIQVVVLTGVTEITAQDIKNAGAAAKCTKPVGPSTLLRMLDALRL